MAKVRITLEVTGDSNLYENKRLTMETKRPTLDETIYDFADRVKSLMYIHKMDPQKAQELGIQLDG